jgi:serine/threonine protein kinase
MTADDDDSLRVAKRIDECCDRFDAAWKSGTQVKRFYSEAESAAHLDHPNIVSIYEVGEHEGDHYFSMAFVEGSSLAAQLNAGPLEPRESAEIMKQVAAAIQYAHDRGVIHRDLKPSNTLLDLERRPRITDFGLAKRVTDAEGMTRTGDVLGTPSYMPPEQAAGEIDAVGPTSDVYALGAVLYALLSGRPPFQAASSVDTLRQVVDQEPIRLRQWNSAIPRDLETITQKCLEKSVARRYATADALARDLDNFLTGRPIQARPTSSAERAWRWCRRNPVVSAGGANAAHVAALRRRQPRRRGPWGDPRNSTTA